MTIESDGLVIKEQKIGETDKLITVLTSQYGSFGPLSGERSP